MLLLLLVPDLEIPALSNLLLHEVAEIRIQRLPPRFSPQVDRLRPPVTVLVVVGLGGGGETVPFVGGLLLHLFFDLLAFSALEKLLLLSAIRRILRCKGAYIGPFFLVRIMT